MSDAVVRLAGVGKMYKVFPSRADNVIDALGLTPLLFWRPVRYREFWALRGFEFELKRGQRIGVIGRNGAGKTTLLKLLTGNLAPTEGELEVKGTVQPLIDLGAGFHPEFTGYENIRAALVYQGLSRAEVREAEAEIAEFTELGRFLTQPIKTYSMGMLARLAFAAATVVKPEILVIDEVLGAGDAYFWAKSTDRMRRLVESGASVILVSHALDQITRFCEHVLWLDRGQIVMNGPALEVVKAYQEHIQILEDRRLKAKNRKVMLGKYSAEESESPTDSLVVKLTLTGRGAACEVERVSLLKDGVAEDQLEIGAPQDADSKQSSFVVTEGGGWSTPEKTDSGLCRRLRCGRNGAPKSGSAVFALFLFFDDATYEVEMSYRSHGSSQLLLEVWLGNVLQGSSEVPASEGRWATHRVSLKRQHVDGAKPEFDHEKRTATRTVRRWPGEGSLMIEQVWLLGARGEEQAVFQVGTPLTLRLTFQARRSGTFDVLPAATLYRVDGILVSNHVGTSQTFTMAEGESQQARLDFGPLNLGNGHYVFSVGLYRKLSAEESVWYDLIAHSYEFQVVGNERFDNGIFRHPGEWRFE